MYSGTTLTNLSGRVIGAHQKIDRVARQHLGYLVPDNRVFPSSRSILHFEGKHGPDAIKRKSPAKDEPWHYFDPTDEKDTGLTKLIEDHYMQLVTELKSANRERAAFEAAWLAHAIVDGLTPAHHYPYEEKLAELRGGEGNETRNSIKQKLVLPGDTPRERLKNNWKMWGPRGLMTAHGLFELGIASLIAPMTFSEAVPSEAEIKRVLNLGVTEHFRRHAKEIAALNLYDRYHKSGWTTRLSLDVRKKLMPTIIETVTLAWYSALVDAEIIEKS